MGMESASAEDGDGGDLISMACLVSVSHYVSGKTSYKEREVHGIACEA
jgi:hypothetical protein